MSKYKYDEDGYRVTKTPWEEREKAKTAAKAMEYLADFLSDDGIDASVEGNLSDVSAFCKKWSIPFNAKLHHKIMAEMDSKRWDRDDDGYTVPHYWTSSSEGC